MPEPIPPGVYFDEAVAATAQVCDGVASSADLRSLADAWGSAMRVHVPEWTDSRDADPGVTLIELFAFVAESELFRVQPPARARGTVARLARSLHAWSRWPDCSDALRRPHYFSGRVLDGGTLAQEQAYHREKSRRLNRALFGFGVVSGLGVHADDANASRFTVGAGVALDENGELLVLPCAVAFVASGSTDALTVTLRYGERACEPVPTPDGSTQMSTIEEGCVVGLQANVEPPAIALARIVRTNDGWRIDPAFVALHVA